MSKKGNDTPSSIRIRENQRRSRNQRKELIHDLQRRVQEYEAKGVAATQDMQRAARKVAEENLRLRSMLASRGVSRSEIDAYLRSFDVGSEQNVPQGANNTLLPLQHMGLAVAEPTSAYSVGEPGLQPFARSTARNSAQPPAQPCTQLQHPHSQNQVGNQRNVRCTSKITQCANRDMNQETVPACSPEFSMPISTDEATYSKPEVEERPCQRAANNAVLENTPPFSILENDADCPNTASCFCAPTSTPKEQSLDTGLLISCETAATIIAEMRGDGDRNRIRARLGCQGEKECTVKNTLVLELMDERE